MKHPGKAYRFLGSILAITALVLIVAGCRDRGGADSERVARVRIVDPGEVSVGIALSYIDAALLSGNVEVELNGHVYRYHDRTPETDSVPKNSEIVIKDGKSTLRTMLHSQRPSWATVIPGDSTRLSQFWDVIDALDEARVPYSVVRELTRPSPDILIEFAGTQ